jgi:hypothetical protein
MSQQIDIEEAIAAAKQRSAPQLETFKELRERERERLAGLAQEIEKAIKDAKPGSPLHRELSVRSGRRLAESVLKRAKALSQVTEPQPWMTAPTRERVDQAGEAPLKKVTYASAGDAQGVSHKWGWAVDRAHSRHVLTDAEYMAARRFRRAFLEMARAPAQMSYGEDKQGPSWRTPVTKREAQAGREFQWIWERLEPKMRSEAWALILQQPLAGESEPLSVIEFGKLVGKTNCEKHARGFAYGVVLTLLIRLAGLYRLFDVVVDEEGYQRAAALCESKLGERAEREGWTAELFEFCRREQRLPQDKMEIDALVAAAHEQLLMRPRIATATTAS